MRFFLTIAVVLFAGCAEESNHRKGGKAKEFDLNLTLAHYGRGVIGEDDLVGKDLKPKEIVDQIANNNKVQVALITEIFLRFGKRLPTVTELTFYQDILREMKTYSIPLLISIFIETNYDMAKFEKDLREKKVNIWDIMWDFHYNLAEMLMIEPDDRFLTKTFIPNPIFPATLPWLFRDALRLYNQEYIQLTLQKLGTPKEGSLKLDEKVMALAPSYAPEVQATAPKCDEKCLLEFMSDGSLASLLVRLDKKNKATGLALGSEDTTEQELLVVQRNINREVQNCGGAPCMTQTAPKPDIKAPFPLGGCIEIGKTRSVLEALLLKVESTFCLAR